MSLRDKINNKDILSASDLYTLKNKLNWLCNFSETDLTNNSDNYFYLDCYFTDRYYMNLCFHGEPSLMPFSAQSIKIKIPQIGVLTIAVLAHSLNDHNFRNLNSPQKRKETKSACTLDNLDIIIRSVSEIGTGVPLKNTPSSATPKQQPTLDLAVLDGYIKSLKEG